MWKQLFSEAPPGALEYVRVPHVATRRWSFTRNLLSPRRKLFYAFFALAPGTTLGLYLYSVKLEMDRDNERIRLEQITEEMAEQNAREQKDAVLANAIEDLRARIQRLEAEALASNGGNVPHLPVAPIENKPAVNPELAGKTEVKNTELPEAIAGAAAFWNEQKKMLLSSFKKDDSPVNEPSTPAPAAPKHTAPSGINERVKMRQQEQLRKDVKAFKAAKAEQSASDSP